MATIIFVNNSDTGVSFLTHRNVSIAVMSGASFVMELDPIVDAYSAPYMQAHYDELIAELNESLELGGGLTVSYDIPDDWGSKQSYSVMEGASASADGVHGLVPEPKAGDERKTLLGNGTWGISSSSNLDFVAPSENGDASSRDYSVGDQFLRYGDLCSATADISAGDVLVEGSGGNYGLSASISSQLSDFLGATGSSDGSSGSVPAPQASDKNKLLGGDGHWKKGNFVGTMAQWNALSLAEKLQYDTADIGRF